jgi:hypothetical protein
MMHKKYEWHQNNPLCRKKLACYMGCMYQYQQNSITLILCVGHNGIFKQTKKKSLKPFIIPILDPFQNFHPLFKSRINLYIWMKFHLHLLEKVKKLRKANQEEVMNVIDIGL